MELSKILDNEMEKYNNKRVSVILNNEAELKELYQNILFQNGLSLDKNRKIFKDNIIENILSIKEAERKNHMIVSFALGLYLSSFLNLGQIISKYYDEQTKGQMKNSFYNVWSLLSLLHDIGYCDGKEELTDEKIDAIFNKKPIKTEKNTYNIKINAIIIYNDSHYSATFNYDKEKDFSSYRFDVKTYKAYNKWRREENAENKSDHGIFGGYWLFSSFLRTRSILDSLENNKEDYKTYLLYDLAYKIMDHNIWKANDKNISDYEKNGLFNLVGDNYKKIDINEPLLYLLCLTDTIEMIKKFNDINLLKDCSITVDNNIITISYKEKLRTNKEFSFWIESIKSMTEWMFVKVEEQKNTIIISYPEKK